MKSFLLFSPQPRAGVGTVAVNLATALGEAGYKVLLAGTDANTRCRQWLDTLLERHPNLSWHAVPRLDDLQLDDERRTDYLLVMAGNIEDARGLPRGMPFRVICIIAGTEHSCEDIVGLDLQLRQITPTSRGIDLLVHNMVHSGEWEESGRLLLCLGEKWGWEKIADPLPHCEAIHDLPLEGKTVWELPPQYSNRRAAFQSLVDQVLQSD